MQNVLVGWVKNQISDTVGPRQANLVLIAYASSEGSVSPEPPLLAHTSSKSRGTFRQKARSLAPLNGWACAVKICHDGMLEDTNSLDGAQLSSYNHLDSHCLGLQHIHGKGIFSRPRLRYGSV